jgi:cyanophycinase
MERFELSPVAPGPLVVIGGAEDKTGECAILRELVGLAGGPRARFVVLTVASEYPREVGALYATLFKSLGVRSARVIHVERREDANAPGAVRAIERASCIFFTGGIQSRITRLFVGSAAEAAVRSRHQAGAVLAGTSAGAAAMSSVMIVGGHGRTSPRIGSFRQGSGLGFVSDAIVDQHFAERGRLGRLLFAVAEHPGHLGLGIDENTALVLRGDEFEVIGESSVTVVDGSALAYTNLGDLDGKQGALALSDVTLHVLPAGHRFSMSRRRPITPAESAVRHLRSASA